MLILAWLVMLGGPKELGASSNSSETRSGHLVILVTDAKTLRPIRFAEVRLLGNPRGRSTDSTGSATFRDLRSGRHTVYVWASEPIRNPRQVRYVPADSAIEWRSKRRILVHGDRVDTLRMRIEPSRPYRVRRQFDGD